MVISVRAKYGLKTMLDSATRFGGPYARIVMVCSGSQTAKHEVVAFSNLLIS